MHATQRDRQWMRTYQLAAAYFRRSGNLLIPGNYMIEGQCLGAWIRTQRWEYRHLTNPMFTQERIDMLNAIGMVWHVGEAAWETMYLCCREYLEEHGDIRVPQSYVTAEGLRLGTWLNMQRMHMKSNKLSAQRIRRLEALQIHWQPEKLRRSQWDSNFGLLKEYQKTHGDIAVPSGYIDPSGVKLGVWFHNQRSNHKRGTLLLARKEKLESLGMAWEAIEGQWERTYQQARCYYETHGHINPYSNRDHQMDAALRAWLIRQRQLYNSKQLPPDKIQAFENIGMLWDIVGAQWQAAYEQAQAFFYSYGHLHVPKDTGSPITRKLGRWIATQRKVYRKNGGMLKEDRVKKLEAIGMAWDASVDADARWEEWFSRAEAFYWKKGHLDPPRGQLCTWVLAQKYKKKGNRGGLTDSQIRRLDSIGMVWDVIDAQWMHMYGLAQEYYLIHEKLNIPVHYIAKGGEHLGRWIAGQRTAYKNMQMGLRGGGRTQISAPQIKKLNSIEMIWDASVLSTNTSFQERAIHYYLKQSCPDACKISHWESLGYEIDVYLPALKTGIEYDGHMHAGKAEHDGKKNRACLENDIRLIRIREPNLPVLQDCTVIQLDDLSEAAFERGLHKLFEALAMEAPAPDVARDRSSIYADYRDYVTYRWDAIYGELWEYHRIHGQLPQSLTLKSKKGTSFTAWMSSQRTAYWKNELTACQIRKLEKLGFLWTPLQTHWEAMYSLAQAYGKEFGDLRVPAAYVTAAGEKLGRWIHSQRRSRKDGVLPAKRIHQLDKLGMAWALMELKRQAVMDALRDYRKKHGNLQVPATFVDRNGLRLGDWLVRWRAQYRDGSLDKRTQCQLEDMGIQWAPYDDRWEEMYLVAVYHYAQHGSIWVSPEYITPEGKPLGSWLTQQRMKYYKKGRHSSLHAEQLEKLEQLGMVWDPYTMRWMQKYQAAKLYFETHGHLRVPADYITENGIKLGMWLSSQRQAIRGNPNFLMTEERKCLLDAIGMNWSMRKYSSKCAWQKACRNICDPME